MCIIWVLHIGHDDSSEISSTLKTQIVLSRRFQRSLTLELRCHDEVNEHFEDIRSIDEQRAYDANDR